MEVLKMSKVVQISILGKVSGNVNADEVIGTRITLKKMYSSSGEVLPFVSARAVKFAIRQALKEKGFEIDPLIENPQAEESLRLSDTGNPARFADNDLFGYMVSKGRGEGARRRQAPIAFSYFKALRDTPIKAEFGARFPREGKEEGNPVPFEVEVAEFIGRFNCIIYENVGKFEEKEIEEDIKKILKIEEKAGKRIYKIDDEERVRRIRAFSEILLTPSYVLPRRTNSLNIPEYIAVLVVFSKKGPLPVFQYLDYDFEKGRVNLEKLKMLLEREEIKNKIKGDEAKILLIDYFGEIEEIPEGIKKASVSEVIEEIVSFLKA
ncbi:MAG: type I-B CRISPR-associated protein Cas7/Cst2/DevR [Candidatus Omnitrophica bacterium 4484_70.2]|nr:MAG: type I-B CRISPR-associated protein Cas7/Cst2/DevR [Candidatus Omnitrophica bacterium 4484_70.2]